MKKNNLKICSFYVSDWHLTAMLLPYIEDAINRGEHLDTILEKNISYNMKEILTRVKISDKTKEDIVKIGWESKKLIKYNEIKKFMEKAIKNSNNITIFVEGSKERIECVNIGINKWLKRAENKITNKEIKIVNCYEVTEFNEGLQEILDKHDKILNTSGIHEIEEMYSGYVKRRA